MYRVAGSALAIGLLTLWSPAHAASSLSCAERFQAAGIDPGKLSPGQRGRLDGYEFIVASDDLNAAKICARIDAEKASSEALRSQFSSVSTELSRAKAKVDELSSGGPIKQNYLIIDGCLLAWAIIASIWAGYFAGRLNPRHRHSF